MRSVSYLLVLICAFMGIAYFEHTALALDIIAPNGAPNGVWKPQPHRRDGRGRVRDGNLGVCAGVSALNPYYVVALTAEFTIKTLFVLFPDSSIANVGGSSLLVGDVSDVAQMANCNVVVNDSGFYDCNLKGSFVGVLRQSEETTTFTLCEIQAFTSVNIGPKGSATASSISGSSFANYALVPHPMSLSSTRLDNYFSNESYQVQWWRVYFGDVEFPVFQVRVMGVRDVPQQSNYLSVYAGTNYGDPFDNKICGEEFDAFQGGTQNCHRMVNSVFVVKQNPATIALGTPDARLALAGVAILQGCGFVWNDVADLFPLKVPVLREVSIQIPLSSTDLEERLGASYCGDLEADVTMLPAFCSFDKETVTLTCAPPLRTLEADWPFDVIQTAVQYPVETKTTTVNIQVEQCFVDSYEVDPQHPLSLNSTVEYDIGAPLKTVALPRFTQTPVCGHAMTYQVVPSAPWYSYHARTHSIRIFSMDPQFADTVNTLDIEVLIDALGPQEAQFKVQVVFGPPPNTPPAFETALPSIIEVSKTEDFTAWFYKFPDTVDVDDDEVSVKVTIGGLFAFVKYVETDSKLEIADLSSSTVTPGSYFLKVELDDGRDTVQERLILEITDFVAVEAVAEEVIEEEKAAQGVAETVSESVQSTFSGVLDSTEDSSGSQTFAPVFTPEEIEEFTWLASLDTKKLNAEKDRKSDENPDYPVPYVKSVSATGRIEIGFSTELVVAPNIDMINNSKIKIGSVERPVLEVELVPGPDSDPETLKMTYKVTLQKEKLLVIEIVFEKAIYVSASGTPDSLKITFHNKYLFMSKSGYLIQKQHQVLTRDLPPQLQKGRESDVIVETVDTIEQGTQYFLATNFLLNIILSAALQHMWSMINTQQIIVMMPLLKVTLPANAGVFFNAIFAIAAFDFFEVEDYVNAALSLDPTDPFSSNFDSIGFGSIYIINNLGPLSLTFIIYPLVVLLHSVLKSSIGGHWRAEKPIKSLGESLFYGSAVGIMQESYSLLAICCFINLTNLRWANYGQVIQSLITILCLIVLIAYPVGMTLFLRKHFAILGDKQMKQRFGAYYQDLNVTKSRWVLFWPLWFLMRRALMAVTCVLVTKHLIVQVYLVVMQSIVAVDILGLVKPHNFRTQNYFEQFNEVVILFTLYMMMCFTPFVDSIHTKYYLGYVVNVIVATHILVNLLNIMFHSGTLLKRRYMIRSALKRFIKARKATLEKWVKASKGPIRTEIKRKKALKFQAYLEGVPYESSEVDNESQVQLSRLQVLSQIPEVTIESDQSQQPEAQIAQFVEHDPMELYEAPSEDEIKPSASVRNNPSKRVLLSQRRQGSNRPNSSSAALPSSLKEMEFDESMESQLIKEEAPSQVASDSSMSDWDEVKVPTPQARQKVGILVEELKTLDQPTLNEDIQISSNSMPSVLNLQSHSEQSNDSNSSRADDTPGKTIAKLETLFGISRVSSVRGKAEAMSRQVPDLQSEETEIGQGSILLGLSVKQTPSPSEHAYFPDQTKPKDVEPKKKQGFFSGLMGKAQNQVHFQPYANKVDKPKFAKQSTRQKLSKEMEAMNLKKVQSALSSDTPNFGNKLLLLKDHSFLTDEDSLPSQSSDVVKLPLSMLAHQNAEMVNSNDSLRTKSPMVNLLKSQSLRDNKHNNSSAGVKLKNRAHL